MKLKAVPNQFIPSATQKNLVALSEFVIDAAISDWHHFVLDREDLELAVNIPLKVLTRAACIENIIKKLPHDHRFHRGLVETDVSDAIADPGATKCVAAELMRHQLALSIDDVAEDWIELCAVEDAPLAEIKVDRSVVAGCAKSQAKQSVCRRIVEFARRIEVRTVAEGVETRADLLAAREIGFDLVQGYLCGKPLDRKQFGSLLREPWCAIPQYARAA